MTLFPGVFAIAFLAQAWTPQQSTTTAGLRGVHAVSATVVWASGTKGTVLRTTDGGATWQARPIAGAADLDFRAVWAFDEKVAFAMSAGAGEKSRIYKTTDGGAQWRMVQPNTDPKGFWDAMAFWDEGHGIVLGDPVDGKFTILTTDDGGASWQRQKGPASRGEEGAFAASNTCLVVRGSREAWFASGGVGGSRVFHSTDGGRTWTIAAAPVRNDSASQGIFSLAFAGARGIAVGGDYNKPPETEKNIALTVDGGKTWKAPVAGPAGFRSAVVWLADRKMWIVTGTSGSDSSPDGETWTTFDRTAYNAMSFAAGEGWAVGPNGAIGRFTIGPRP